MPTAPLQADGLAPTALVLLASEQLWPNIHSIEHWGGTAEKVFIYHTDNESKSGEPARRLARFCHERHTLNATPVPGPNSPEGVVARLEHLLATEPAASWIINATGGTKPMYDGAATFRGRSGVRVVYREFGRSDHWFELGRTTAGIPTTTPFPVPAAATDNIPVDLLLRTLWETPTLRLDSGRVPERLPFPDVAQALVEANGNWGPAFARVGAPVGSGESSGVLFERYVAAALLEMGVTNLRHSVKQIGQAAGGPANGPGSTQEIDIVANYGARLLVLDCKLTADDDRGEGITSQIRQAALTARKLGGIGGEVVLLRPNRELTGPILELARDLNVRAIDRTHRGCFFQQLAAFVGCPLTDSLRRADQLFADPIIAQRAFPTSPLLHRAARAALNTTVIELERLCGDWRREFGQDWAATRVRNELYYLQLANSGERSRDRFTDAVRTVLEPHTGQILGLDVSISGDTLYALFAVDPADERAFRQFLASRTGQPLIA